MTSMRREVNRSAVVVVFVIVIAMITMLYAMPRVKEFSQHTSRTFLKMQSAFRDMDVPISVLSNVAIVAARDGVDKLSPKMKEAYTRNADLLKVYVRDFTLSLEHFDSSIATLNKLILYRDNQEVLFLLDQLERLKAESSRYPNLSDAQIEDARYYGDMEAAYDTKREIFDSISRTYEDLRQRLLSDAMNFVALLITLLVLALSIFLIFSKYFLDYAFKFIVRSFEHLEGNHFDFRDLPHFKPLFIEEKAIVEQVKEIMEERKFSADVKSILMSKYVIDDAIEGLFHMVTKEMGVDRLGIAFVDYSRKKLVAEFGIANYDNILLGPGFESDFLESTLTQMLSDKRITFSGDLRQQFYENPDSRSLALLCEEGVQSNMVVPLLVGNSVFGMLFFSSLEKNHFNENHMRLAQNIIYEVTGLLNHAYFSKVVLAKMTESFSELVEGKDSDTGEHIERMVSYSVVLANGLKDHHLPGYQMSKKSVLELERYAPSHDIGKVGIPDHILKKPGKLNSEEWQLMKTHPLIGANVFKGLREGLNVFDSEFFKLAEDVARYHHEKWDGSGYPYGLSGIQIPVSARIVAIADVFDALSSKRVYKEAFSFERAVEIIQQDAGTHFDPVLVDIFLANIDQIHEIYLQGRETGSTS